MDLHIREAKEEDINCYIEFTLKLSDFNRINHDDQCKYDDYSLIIDSIEEKAKATFKTRDDDVRIVIADIDSVPVGYALGKVYEEEKIADNGSGRIGLLDELFVDEGTRGHGAGKRLFEEMMNWMKEKEIKRVKLHAYSWNSNAKKFYEKLGFNEYAVSYEKFI